MEKETFYAYISRMKYINRWGLMRNTDTENIQEHSLEVAILAHALAIIHNEFLPGGALEDAKRPDGSEYGKVTGRLEPEKACLFAVFHDSDEIITGDMPTPIKYFNPVIKENYHKIEEISKEKLVSMLPEFLQSTYRDILFYDSGSPEYYPVVKAADRLSAHIKCVKEVQAGNIEFTKAKKATFDSMTGMKLPELDYFTDHFLDSYGLTLDEIE